MSEAKTTVITDKELENIESSLGDKIKNSLEDNSLKKDIIKKLGLEPGAVITPEDLNGYGDKFYKSKNEEEQKLAVDCYKLAADKGDAEGMNNYGWMLKNGKGVEKNEEEAVRYFKIAIEKGNVDAMYNYAWMLENGKGVNKDKKEAAKYYKMAADKGDAEGMNSYAVMLKNGKGVEKNEEEAVRYFKMAIENGNAKAMFNYALMLKNGYDGVEPNLVGAAEYFTMAANKYTEEEVYKKNALEQLINILNNEDFKVEDKKLKEYYDFVLKEENKGLFNGDNEYKDKINQIRQKSEELEEKMKKPANTDPTTTAEGDGEGGEVESTPEPEKKDNKEDLIELRGVGFNDDEINKIKRAAGESSISIADDGKISPSNLNKIGNKLRLSDKNLITKCYKAAADKGNANAMNNYALMLYNGYSNVPANKEEAVRYFKMAIEKGNVDAMFSYAERLYKGDGIKENKGEAKEYFKKILEIGSDGLIFLCANILSEGGDREEAAEFYKAAADKGRDNFIYGYAVRLYKGDGIEENKGEAKEYFKKILEIGNIDQIFKCASILSEGGDRKEAAEFYKAAADKGKSNAMFEYAKMLYKGDGITENKGEAAKYFKMAADKRNVKAMFKYAKMLYKGDGIDVNKEEAGKYFKKILEKYNNYKIDDSKMCKFAKDLYKDNNKEWISEFYKAIADKEKDFNVMFKYANMLYNGDRIDVNKKEAGKYFEKILEKYREIDSITNSNTIKGDVIVNFANELCENGNNKWAAEYYSVLLKNNYIANKVPNKLIKILCDKGAIKDLDKDKLEEYYKILYGTRLRLSSVADFNEKMKEIKGNIDNFDRLMAGADSMEKPESADATGVNGSGKEKKDEETKKSDSESKSDSEEDLIYLDKEKFTDNEIREIRELGADAVIGDKDRKISPSDLNDRGYWLFFHTKNNKKLAAKCYKLAADNGNVAAMFRYAEMLCEGYDDVPAATTEAEKYFKMAADKGDASITFIYADMLYEGNGITMNKTKAVEYYKIAADKGDADIILKYANMLYEGDRITMNKAEAANYYKMAADKKNIDAKFKYAKMLYGGDEIDKNENEAKECFKEILEEYKKREYETVYQKIFDFANGLYDIGNKEQAALYYKTVVEGGHAEAKFKYANMLYKGDGIPANKKEAAKYYKEVLYETTEEYENKGIVLEKLVDILNVEEFDLEDKETLKEYYKFVLEENEKEYAKSLGDDFKEKINQIQQKLNKLEEEIKEKAKENEKFDKKRKKKHEEPRSLKQTITAIAQKKEKQKKDKKTLKDIRNKMNKRIRTEVKKNDDGEIKAKEEIDKEKAEALADKYKSRVRAYETEKKDLKEVKKALENQQNSQLANEYLDTFKESNENKVVSDATFSTIVNLATKEKKDLSKNEEIKNTTLSAVKNYEKAGFGGAAYSCPPSTTDINVKFYDDGFLVGCLDENMKKLFDEPLTINMNGVSEEDKIKLNNTLLLFKTNPAIAFASLSKIEGIKMTMGDKDINIGDGVGKQLMEAYSVAAKTRKQIDKLEYLRNSDEIKNLEDDNKKDMINMLIETTIDGLSSNKGTREEILKDNEAVNNINDVAKIVKGIVENVNDNTKGSLVSKIMEEYNKYKDSMKEENEIALFKVVVNTALLQQCEEANKRLKEVIKSNEVTSVDI